MTLTADVITHSSPAFNNSGDVPAFIPVVHTRLNYSGLCPFRALGTSRSSRPRRGSAHPTAPGSVCAVRAGESRCSGPLLWSCWAGAGRAARAKAEPSIALIWGLKRGGVMEGEFCSKMWVLFLFTPLSLFLLPFEFRQTRGQPVLGLMPWFVGCAGMWDGCTSSALTLCHQRAQNPSAQQDQKSSARVFNTDESTGAASL